MTNPRTPEQEVDDLLAHVPDASLRNIVERNERLAAAIEYTLDKMSTGELQISLKRFYLDHLRTRFGGPRCYDTVKAYVRDTLKRDFQSGKPLSLWPSDDVDLPG